VNRKENVNKLKEWVKNYGHDYSDINKPNTLPSRCGGCICEPDEGSGEVKGACLQP